MWEAIAYVSSGVTLIAFIAATVAWVYKAKSEERERLIRTAKPEQRADLVRNALEFFHVESSGLTKEQQYKLALEQIHARARRFKVTAVVVCFLAVVAAVVTVYAITENRTVAPGPLKTENETRFDVKFGNIKFFKIGEKIRAELVLHAIPLTKRNEEAATIFAGMIVVHNEELFEINRDSSTLTCQETKSCLTARVFREYQDNPLIVRGGDLDPINITSVFDLPASVKLIRIYWEFYQKEANDHNLCVIDNSKQSPKEGIPFLKVVTKGGAETKDVCWKATDVTIVRVET